MAVLMTYHKLVEREEKNVDIQWKVASILLLALAIICSFSISLTLNKFINAFDGHCPLNAKIYFIEGAEKTNCSQTGEETSGVTVTSNVAHLSDCFNASYSNYLTQSSDDPEYPRSQVEFLATHKVDETSSVWGENASCDFGMYMPICQSFFGLIMATMFVICGRGGKSDSDSFLPQPWRIVTPAIVFFLVMTILSISNLVVIQNGLSTFCDSLEESFPDIGCDIAINHYKDVGLKKILLAPSVYRKILSAFNIVAFIFWLASLLVLLARIMFVIDFQLVRVTVKTVEYENANETSNLQVIEVEQNGKHDSSGAPIATTEC